MSFNKRYVTEEIITHIYLIEGYEYLCDYILKPDVLISQDVTSTKVIKLIREEGGEHKLKTLLKL